MKSKANEAEMLGGPHDGRKFYLYEKILPRVLKLTTDVRRPEFARYGEPCTMYRLSNRALRYYSFEEEIE